MGYAAVLFPPSFGDLGKARVRKHPCMRPTEVQEQRLHVDILAAGFRCMQGTTGEV